MNESTTAPGLRARLPLAPKREQNFRWRGNEITRVEGFTDAVFAFAVTLVVMALEVPHTIDGLLDVVRGFPALVICFTLLMMFWTAHYRYHRRYGLEDSFTRVLTMSIIVLVLLFAFPLKYLFTMLTVQIFQLHMHDAPQIKSAAEGDILYLIYGLGFGGVWSTYGLLYWHAWRKRAELELNETEMMLTRADLWANAIYVFVCLLSVALALTIENAAIPGLIYWLLWPLQHWNGYWHGKRVAKLAAAATPG